MLAVDAETILGERLPPMRLPLWGWGAALSAPSIRGRHGKVSRTNIAALVRRVDFTVMVAVLEQIRFGSPAFD